MTLKHHENYDNRVLVMMNREMLCFCFFMLFSLCVSHVVTCRFRRFVNPTACILLLHCCTTSMEDIHTLPSAVSHQQLQQNVRSALKKNNQPLWYKLFLFFFVQLKRDFCSGDVVFVAPWWSNSLLSGF